jgi:type I restriction enzyme, S subunit
MKKLKLTDIAPYSGKRVQSFDGVKRYMSTGDLREDNLSFEDVTYENRPSRADILVSEGDILFAKMTNTNKALQIDKELDGIIVSTGFSVHRPLENRLLGEYFLHFLKHESFHRQKNKFCTGAIQSAISNSGIEKIFVPIPDFEDQPYIANLLSKAENLISQRKESLRLLDDFLKSTFLEMFGNPLNNPKGWYNDTLDSFCEEIVDCPHETPEYEINNTGFYCVRSSDILDGYIDLSETKFVSVETYNQRIIRHEPKAGEVIYTREGGRLGNAARVPYGKNVCLGQRMMLFIADCNYASNEFIWALLNNDSFKKLVTSLSGGGAAPRINIGQLKKIRTIRPPVALQNQFTEIVKKTESIKSEYQQSLQELENLYGSLSQMAFKGELTLK